ncbi:hypothetical protein D9M69_516490 [compost metagenome]
MVQPHQQRRRGSRQFDLEQYRPWRSTDGLAQFKELLGQLLEGKGRQSEHRWNAVDDGRNDRGHPSQAKQHHGRDQVNPRRYGLHDVEDRQERLVDPLHPCCQNAERKGDGYRNQHRNRDQGNGLHGRDPQPGEQAECQHQPGKQGHFLVGKKQCQHHYPTDQGIGMRRKQCTLNAAQHRLDHLTDDFEQTMQIGVEPIDGGCEKCAW